MPHPSSERVLVVPAELFDRLGRFQGFTAECDRYLDALFAPKVASFRPRSEVEDDPSLKQIIPYVAFRCRDALFCYTRGVTQGETRLHRLRSLGIGGHVSEEDASGVATLDAYDLALKRELEEEVEVKSSGRLERVGLINDDGTPVGRVHLGVAHIYDLDAPDVIPREEGLAEAAFLHLTTIQNLRSEFETWSQIFLSACLSTGRPHG